MYEHYERFSLEFRVLQSSKITPVCQQIEDNAIRLK